MAVVGCGRWGVNHLRVFASMPHTDVVALVDCSPDRLASLCKAYPQADALTSVEELALRADVDAVVVATPARTHAEVIEVLLQHGKHVLCEKPLTTTSADAERLVELAAREELVLMTGHTFIYNSALNAVRELVREDDSSIYYLYARRTNLGPIRDDVNALWDLASHDVAVFTHLLDALPDWVSATGLSVLGTERADVGFVALGYPGGRMAHIHVSWADPSKVRELVVVGSKRRIVFNDMDALEPVRIFSKGVAVRPEAPAFGELPFLIRDGDIVSPQIQMVEPLRAQNLHFAQCVMDGLTPATDGVFGLNVVTVMEAIDLSIASSGTPIPLDWTQLRSPSVAS